MKNKKIQGVLIGDIHFGLTSKSVTNEDLYNQLNDVFITYIMDNIEDLTYIAILGDFFDRKINLNENSSKLAIKFIDKLNNISLEYGLHLLIIKGTKTHDVDQLGNFKYLEITNPKFKIFNTVDEYVIDDVFKIMCVPEEYMENEDRYYKDYKEAYQEDAYKPDMIIGHGTFDVLAFESQKIDSERNIKGSPVFSFSEWSTYTDGPIIFGHIHVHQAYKKKLYYTGSFTRWTYGEDKPKGFIHHIYDLEDGEHTCKFIENTAAIEFKTYNIKDIIADGDDLKQQLEKIEELKKQKDNIRIVIDDDIKTESLEAIRESLQESESTKIQVKKDLTKNIRDQNSDKYSFLGDNNDIITNIRKYIQVEFNENIDKDDIIELLYEKKKE